MNAKVNNSKKGKKEKLTNKSIISFFNSYLPDKRYWHFAYYLTSIVLTLVIVYLWMGGSHLLATAEEGLIFYNPERTFNLFKSLWIETKMGAASPFFVSVIPLNYIFSLLFQIGLSNWFIQYLVFCFLILIPLFALPKLVSKIIPKGTFLIGVISALFYVFNLYSLSQVFQRFIFPLMFLWSYLPLFLLVWLLWIQEKKIRYLFLLLLSSVLYATAFSLPSSFVVLVFMAVTFGVFLCINSEQKIKDAIYFVGGFIIWIIGQLWWLIPIWLLRNNQTSGSLNSSDNLLSLKDVSKFFPSQEIILLKQTYYYGPGSFLQHFYSKPFTLALSIIIFLFVLVGIFKIFKERKGYYLLALFLIGWFVSKGSNPPFGIAFFSWVFKYFPFLQLFRNPYEKFGVVFLFSYAILFSIGLVWISEKFRRFRYLFLTFSLFIFCGFLIWPMWTGALFDNGVRVSVPNYYKDANNYLNSLDNKRILHMPILQEANAEYVWGYHGEDTSSFLFDRPSLSNFNYEDKKNDIYLNLPDYVQDKNFPKLLSLINVSSIVVHEDRIQNSYNQPSVSDTLNEIRNWKDISSGKKIGELYVYNLPSEYVRNFVYASNKVIVVHNLSELSKKVVSNDFDNKTEVVMAKFQNKNIPHFKLANKLPYIQFKKLSPTEYVAHIKNASGPYILVLSVSDNTDWAAKMGGAYIPDHFEINGFANGWLVKKKGDYTIDITFNIL